MTNNTLRPFFIAAICVAVICGVFGGVVAYAACSMNTITSVEDWYAQDTDNDGIATVDEGDYDFDSDGYFTAADAAALMNCRYIAWFYAGQSAAPLAASHATCLIDFTVNPVSRTCLQLTGYDCYGSSITNCVYSKKR